jgi:glycosyltransferase involved in cell wall biosynthesis
VTGGSLFTVLRVLLRTVLRRRADLVVCCHDVQQASSLESLLEFVSVLPARQRILIDAAGIRRPIPAATARSALAAMLVVPLLAATALATRVGLCIWRDQQDASPSRARGSVTAIVLPKLPDLSHTFVYREVLGLKRRHPEYLLVSLERGAPPVVHGDAAALLALTTFVPVLSTAAYLWAYLRAWFRQPADLARVVRLFQAQGDGRPDPFCFIRLEHLQHSSYPARGFMLAEFARRHGIGYMHVYGSTYPALRALVAHQLLGIRYSVSTYVDFERPSPYHMLSTKFAHAEFVVACTAFCVTRLRALAPDLESKWRILHHALPAGQGDRAVLRPQDGTIRLVYVGRFALKKGIDTLVDACALLRERGAAFACDLYGAGEEQPALERLVADRRLSGIVTFRGPIQNDRIYSVMNRDDVFVSPSRSLPDGERDGIPVTLLEAMAAGITVVTTTVSGIPELVVDGHNGYMVAPDDPGALAERLFTLLSCPELKTVVSAAACDTIRRHFSLESAVEQLGQWITRETVSAAGTGSPASRRNPQCA